jgi:hypothetical protein
MSDQSADAGGTNDSQTDHDRRVRDILDRVAKGHLSSDEAATLLAAINTGGRVAAEPAASQAGGQTDVGPTDGDGGSSPRGATEGIDAKPSADVWADVVDTPDPIAAGAAAEGSVVDDQAQDESAWAPLEAEIVREPAQDEPVEIQHSSMPVPAGVQRVTIRAIGRRVRLTGEPAITGVAVDGPHQIKRDGDTLAISSEGDMGVSIDGLTMLRTRSVGDLKSHVGGFAKELSIRVNPSLQVEIEVTGGSVVAERLPGLSRVRVTAGTARVADVDGPIDLLVQAGSATLDAQLTKGHSRVRVETGTANVTLRRGSDVRVHTDSQLGKVSWTGAVNGQSKDVEIGRGRAALDVEVLVGTAQITSD